MGEQPVLLIVEDEFLVVCWPPILPWRRALAP